MAAVGSKIPRDVAGKAAAFFREVMRLVPSLMRQYGLEEIISPTKLRSNIHQEFRKHASVRDPQAVDVLILKGRMELEECVKNFKQRHHIIANYIVAPETVAAKEAASAKLPHSEFLERFYKGARA